MTAAYAEPGESLYPPRAHELFEPPSPVWADDASGLTVWMNGGLVEISMAGDFARLLPREIPDGLGAALDSALAAAQLWAERWDIDTRSYRSA